MIQLGNENYESVPAIIPASDANGTRITKRDQRKKLHRTQVDSTIPRG
jgi:hypothetical protein